MERTNSIDVRNRTDGNGAEALPRRNVADHRQHRREIMLQHLVGIDAGLVALPIA